MFLTIKLCTYGELFEIELFICIKMDLALNNLQSKSQTKSFKIRQRCKWL